MAHVERVPGYGRGDEAVRRPQRHPRAVEAAFGVGIPVDLEAALLEVDDDVFGDAGARVDRGLDQAVLAERLSGTSKTSRAVEG